ncbi:MAG: glycosyltransferase family 9 protein [Coriobacteriia bacterium]|nr:glycosyltransferase family 9 protein [Coriobacteriia bacterium]
MDGVRGAEPRSVVVVRALPGVGDFLCAVPALRALRRAAPGARLTLIGLPSVSGLVEAFAPLIDELLPFPGYPGIPEVPLNREDLERFLRDARERRFDLAVQMHGNGSAMNGFLLELGAREVLGYRMPCAPAHPGLAPYDPGLPEVSRWVRLVSGAEGGTGERVRYPVARSDREEARRLLEAAGLGPGGYACLHPGAAAAERRWAPEGFVRVAEEVVAAGVGVALTGTAEEAPACEAVVGAARVPVADLCASTSLGVLAAVLQGARLVVCNDTGVAHLAAAVEAPTVVVYTGASDPRRWAPAGSVRAVLPRDEARPRDETVPERDPELPAACGGLPCPILADRPRPPGRVPVRAVLAEVRDALSDRPRGRPHVA